MDNGRPVLLTWSLAQRRPDAWEAGRGEVRYTVLWTREGWEAWENARLLKVCVSRGEAQELCEDAIKEMAWHE